MLPLRFAAAAAAAPARRTFLTILGGSDDGRSYALVANPRLEVCEALNVEPASREQLYWDINGSVICSVCVCVCVRITDVSN